MALLLGLLLAPLLVGIIGRTKARFGGRQGPPLVQPYYDLLRLVRKGAVYSRTTTWVFRAGPVVVLGTAIGAAALVPLCGAGGAFAFEGDVLVALALLALGRLFQVLAALDTGSAFEGMGASREVCFGALAEPTTFLVFGVLVGLTGQVSLSAIYAAVDLHLWAHGAGEILLAAAALAIVFSAENARIPFDDPATHLELTMIHEVMILDHSGPDLAFLEYAAALKMWVLGSLVVGLLLPVRTGWAVADAAAGAAGVLAFAGAVGWIESTMARFRMPRVPQMLIGATAISALAMALLVARGGSR